MKKDINETLYLYLDRLVEERDHELRLHVNEAKSDTSKKKSILGLLTGHAIVTDDSCARYELLFKRCVCYSVTDESFARVDDKHARYEGKLLRTYQESWFLDYVRSSSMLLEDLAPGLKHYQLICLNQVINVATEEDPVIS